MIDMNVITPPGPPATTFSPPPDALASRQHDFASVIARASNAVPDEGPDREHAARVAAQDFVAVTLVQPLLKHLRDSSMAAPPFNSTGAETQFRSMMDAQLSQRIVRATRFPLVDTVAKTLLNRDKKTKLPTRDTPIPLNDAQDQPFIPTPAEHPPAVIPIPRDATPEFIPTAVDATPRSAPPSRSVRRTSP